MTMANAVEEESKRTEGKKALAVESFARALRQVRFERRGMGGARLMVCGRRFLRSWLTTRGTIRPTWWPSFGRRTTRASRMRV